VTEHLPECPKSGCPACVEQGQRDALAQAREIVHTFGDRNVITAFDHHFPLSAKDADP
jgi:hypothetical protein